MPVLLLLLHEGRPQHWVDQLLLRGINRQRSRLLILFGRLVVVALRLNHAVVRELWSKEGSRPYNRPRKVQQGHGGRRTERGFGSAEQRSTRVGAGARHGQDGGRRFGELKKFRAPQVRARGPRWENAAQSGKARPKVGRRALTVSARRCALPLGADAEVVLIVALRPLLPQLDHIMEGTRELFLDRRLLVSGGGDCRAPQKNASHHARSQLPLLVSLGQHLRHLLGDNVVHDGRHGAMARRDAL